MCIVVGVPCCATLLTFWPLLTITGCFFACRLTIHGTSRSRFLCFLLLSPSLCC